MERMESLGGEKNAHIARLSGEKKLERSESNLEFRALRQKFAEFSARLFKENHPFVNTLRSDVEFQHLKMQGKDVFDDESTFSTYAFKHADYLADEFNLEDERQQAALLAMLARLDAFQDNEMRKKHSAGLKEAA